MSTSEQIAARVAAKLEGAPDFEVNDTGSIVLLQPRTEAASDWLYEHIPSAAQRLGTAVAIEQRYVFKIIEAIQEDGLTIETTRS